MNEYFKKWVLKDETPFIVRTFTDAQSNNYPGENGSTWFESRSQLVIIFLQPPFLKDPKALYEKQWLKPCCTPLKRPCPGATWQTPTPCLPGDRARQVEKKTGLSFIVILPHKLRPGERWALHSKTILDKEAHRNIQTPWPSLVLQTPPKIYSLSFGELSTQDMKGSAVRLISLVMSTAYRIHWLLNIDTC